VKTIRFIRLESHDLRKSKGDECDVNAWRDKTRGGEVRWFPIGVNPNEDGRCLNT
jgi:hypothetical protein